MEIIAHLFKKKKCLSSATLVEAAWLKSRVARCTV